MSFRKNRIKRNRKGFSLAEIMVVLVIIGLLGSIVTISVRSYLLDAKVTKAKADIKAICEGMERYFEKYGYYPPKDTWKESLTNPSAKFSIGPLRSISKDPWGNEYQYFTENKARDFELICYGADGTPDGEGADKDISSKRLDEDE